MTKETSYGPSVAINSEGDAPEWIEIFPAGKKIVGRDGRWWKKSNPNALITAFNSSKVPIVVDWEHASEAKPKQRTAAAGWIEELAVRNNDAIWARVSWTEQGRRDVASRSYRFISPGFLHASASREIALLTSVGLVHQPNFVMKALAMKNGNQDFLAQIATTLGFREGDEVTEEKILASIEAMKMQSATNAMEPESGSGDWVPRSDFDLAIARIEEFKKEETARFEAEIVSTVDAVIETGDPAFPPAKRDEYLELCRMDGGLERFKSIAQPNADLSLARASTAGRVAPDKYSNTPTGNETNILAHIGLTPKDIE